MGSRKGRKGRQGLEGGRFFEVVEQALPVFLEEFAAKMDQQAEV